MPVLADPEWLELQARAAQQARDELKSRFEIVFHGDTTGKGEHVRRAFSSIEDDFGHVDGARPQTAKPQTASSASSGP